MHVLALPFQGLWRLLRLVFTIVGHRFFIAPVLAAAFGALKETGEVGLFLAVAVGGLLLMAVSRALAGRMGPSLRVVRGATPKAPKPTELPRAVPVRALVRRPGRSASPDYGRMVRRLPSEARGLLR